MRAVCIAVLTLAACGEPPRVVTPRAGAGDAKPRAPDPDLEPHPVRRLLAIDWPNVKLASDTEALALWAKIAPTGADWDDKLEEVPTNLPVARSLAVALLREGNFACRPAPATTHNCIAAPLEVDPPAKTATLSDPCLRRLLALWAIDQLEPDDTANIRDSLMAIASLPPPESQLVVQALRAVPEADQDGRMKMLLAAWAAGQHDVVNTNLAGFDETHLAELAMKHHVEGAIDILSADGHKDVYLRAVADAQLTAKARVSAIIELASAADKLAPDVKAAFVAATKTADCTVAAMAAHELEAFGDKHYLPSRPHTGSIAQMMRGLCVLASYESLQHAGDDSLLASYVPARGLERIEVTYDPLSEVDTDGDGDPHTQRKTDLVARNEVSLPDLEEMVRAMGSCKDTTCTTDTREFRFAFKPAGGELVLSRIESVELPPCQDKSSVAP